MRLLSYADREVREEIARIIKFRVRVLEQFELLIRSSDHRLLEDVTTIDAGDGDLQDSAEAPLRLAPAPPCPVDDRPRGKCSKSPAIR